MLIRNYHLVDTVGQLRPRPAGLQPHRDTALFLRGFDLCEHRGADFRDSGVLARI